MEQNKPNSSRDNNLRYLAEAKVPAHNSSIPPALQERLQYAASEIARVDSAEASGSPAEALVWAGRATLAYGKAGNHIGVCLAWILCGRSQLALGDRLATQTSLYRAENSLNSVSDAAAQLELRREIQDLYSRLDQAESLAPASTPPPPRESFIRATDKPTMRIIEYATQTLIEVDGLEPIRFRTGSLCLRLLHELALRHQEDTGKLTAPLELTASVWPDDASTDISKLNRLRVAFVELRRRGLADVVQTVRRQYRIDPRIDVIIESRALAS